MSRIAYTACKVSSGRHRLRYIFLLATVFGTTFLLVSISNISNIFFISNNGIISAMDTFNSHNTSDRSYTIRTEGCTIPGLEPLDNSIRKYISYPTEAKPCHNATISLLDNNSTHIWVKQENKKFYKIIKEHRFLCCYKSFYRPVSVEDISSPSNDDRVNYRNCIYFTKTIKADDEFVSVVCKYYSKKVYEQYFIFALEVEYQSDNMRTKIDSNYNVVIMGIDAVSRLNFHRTMPKTLNFLKKNGAVELLGYNKVGDNTFPNLIPMLLGIKDVDLKMTCVPSPISTFDNCPFIWEWFRQAGYYTGLGEDSASLGTFNYLKVGFARKPTDFYIHTFINEAERHVGNNKDFNSRLCMNDKYFYKVLLDYIENLMITLRLYNFFGFFWEVTMSHDHLNYPMKMDDDYEIFFKRLQNMKVLNNTVMFLVSDHGIRWGDIRSTKQGRLEERLPFVYILTPPSFQQNYSQAFTNLKLNSNRLTTPFDIHSTLNDLLNIHSLKDITTRTSQLYWRDRSISLFLPIPSNRTCSIAGIDDHWCTCHRAKRLSTKSMEALEASAALILQMNSILYGYKMCAKLKHSETIELTEMQVGVGEETADNWREFMVVIRTQPGQGIFEATLRHDIRGWSLAGTISRLNLYGEQSRCVSNYHLKLYCYCV